MSNVSRIPDDVANKSGAAQTADYTAQWVQLGIKRNEDPSQGSMGANLKALNDITKNDPSLKQYFSTAVQALMDYNGPTDAAKKLPDNINPQVKKLSDTVEGDLRDAKDPTQGDTKKDIDSLSRMTSGNGDLNQYLTPTVRAIVKADKNVEPEDTSGADS